MERLIADANEYAKSIGMAGDLSIDSFSDIVTAIDLVQQKQGIAGTTAKEAATTIEGSLNMTKAAWENLVTSFADPDADIGQAMDNLIVAIVGDKEGEGLLNNIIPAIQRAVEGIGKFLQAAIPALSEQLPALIESFLPVIINSIVTLVTSLIQALPSIVMTLANMMPQLVQMVTTAIINALIAVTPVIVKQAPAMVKAFATALINSIGIVVNAGISLISSLSGAILSNLKTLAGKAVSQAKQIPKKIKSGLGSLASAGRDLIEGLWNGIKAKFDSVISRVKALAAKLPSAVKKVLGISSPSKVFMELGKWIPEGLALGIEKNMGVVNDASGAMADATMFSAEGANLGLEGATGGYGAVEINVYATPQQSALEIAQIVKRELIKEVNQRRVAWV